MTAGARGGATAIGVVLVVVAVLGLLSTLRGAHPSVAIMVLAPAFALAGVLIAMNARMSRLVLGEDDLRVTHLFATRAVKRDSIAGRKLIRSRWLGDSRYAVVDKDGRETRFPPNLTYDRAFHAYVDAFPKL